MGGRQRKVCEPVPAKMAAGNGSPALRKRQHQRDRSPRRRFAGDMIELAGMAALPASARYAITASSIAAGYDDSGAKAIVHGVAAPSRRPRRRLAYRASLSRAIR